MKVIVFGIRSRAVIVNHPPPKIIRISRLEGAWLSVSLQYTVYRREANLHVLGGDIITSEDKFKINQAINEFRDNEG
jgi:hypothetical protein